MRREDLDQPPGVMPRVSCGRSCIACPPLTTVSNARQVAAAAGGGADAGGGDAWFHACHGALSPVRACGAVLAGPLHIFSDISGRPTSLARSPLKPLAAVRPGPAAAPFRLGRSRPGARLRMSLQLEEELMGKERAAAEEADIREMEQKGMDKKDVTLADIASMWVTNIILTYGDPEKYASLQDGSVASEGVVDDLVGGPLFLPLYKYFTECGGVYKLCFGPKIFMVVSDPVVLRHILKENVYSYDKGVLSEILEPFMGQGLIPAPFEVRVRSRSGGAACLCTGGAGHPVCVAELMRSSWCACAGVERPTARRGARLPSGLAQLNVQHVRHLHGAPGDKARCLGRHRDRDQHGGELEQLLVGHHRQGYLQLRLRVGGQAVPCGGGGSGCSARGRAPLNLLLPLLENPGAGSGVADSCASASAAQVSAGHAAAQFGDMPPPLSSLLSLTRSLLVHSLARRPARVHRMSLNTQPSGYGAVGV